MAGTNLSLTECGHFNSSSLLDHFSLFRMNIFCFSLEKSILIRHIFHRQLATSSVVISFDIRVKCTFLLSSKKCWHSQDIAFFMNFCVCVCGYCKLQYNNGMLLSWIFLMFVVPPLMPMLFLLLLFGLVCRCFFPKEIFPPDNLMTKL